MAGAVYYRIGWVVYSDVEPIIAAGGDWLEHFAFIDISNRSQTDHTIGRLTPGLLCAFIVAGNDGRYGTPQWPDASGWQFVTPEARQPGAQQPSVGPVQADRPPCPPPDWSVSPRPTTSVRGDYDADDDGLIEVANLAQLDAIRYDGGGNGSPFDQDLASYLGAFPNAVAGMGCPEEGCTGYELVVDLDFDTNGNRQADAGDTYWNDGAGWEPINFSGTFDGGGHTIANLHIEFVYSDSGFSGGFGLFKTIHGQISGVALNSVVVAVTHDSFAERPISFLYVGGLAGSLSGSLSDSCATGSVSGNADSVGGLVGFVGATSHISESYAAGIVSGDRNVGGLVGSMERGNSISGSYATSTVSGGSNIGGLVGYSGSDSTISESHATGAVSGDHSVGGLVGYSGNSISDSYATGAVSGDHSVGGLVGYSGNSISDSYATGAVSGDHSVGGLVGALASRSRISGSYATGTVVGTGAVGGLVGGGYRSSITESYATGTVNGSGDHVGGLAGSGDSIRESYATGNVSGGRSVGGLAGSGRSISGSYATGEVTGIFRVGGLAGRAVGNTSYSYAVGQVTGSGFVGGLLGESTGTAIDSYWDIGTSDQPHSDGGQGKTTSELQSPTGYTGIYANWNVNDSDPWDFGTSNQYPVLKYGGLNPAHQRR